ncbi:hypothetical protein [Streptomyces qinglanensis]|uniref:hypothetical protein n=1 Tax=Streptomyces qinglanensis TaxID=943816 RepID=UPI003D721FFE
MSETPMTPDQPADDNSGTVAAWMQEQQRLITTLHDRITELEARPSRAQVLRAAARKFEAECPDAGGQLPLCMCHAAVPLRELADAAERDDAGKDTQPGESTHLRTARDGTWYGLPWAAWLDADDQQEFLGEIASAALGYYRAADDDADVLRSVARACAMYRLVAEVDHAQATAPGPDAVEERPVSGACERCGEPPESWCTHCAGCACPDGRAETHAPGGSCPNASAAGAGERQ